MWWKIILRPLTFQTKKKKIWKGSIYTQCKPWRNIALQRFNLPFVHRSVLLFMHKWNMILTTVTGSSVLRDLRQCRHGLAGMGELSSAEDMWGWGAEPDLLYVSTHSTQGASAVLKKYGIQKEVFPCLSSVLPHPILVGNKRRKTIILKRNSAIHNIR